MLWQAGTRPLALGLLAVFILIIFHIFPSSPVVDAGPSKDEIKSRAHDWLAAVEKKSHGKQEPLKGSYDKHTHEVSSDLAATGLEAGDIQFAPPSAFNAGHPPLHDPKEALKPHTHSESPQDPPAPQTPADQPQEPAAPIEKGDKIIVVGKLATEDTSWIARDLPDWQSAIYVVDDESAPLHTSQNKGHEGNAYLTYIIENYSTLPSVIVFTHSHHDSWHVDAEDYSNPLSIGRLQLPYVQLHGYANLRCAWDPGCPAEVKPYRDWSVENPEQGDKEVEYPAVEQNFRSVWWELFGNDEVPETIGVGCCAQFAVSREQVLKRSKEEYEHYLEVINESEIEDEILGRIFEYLWHIIFGREAVQ
ncbi:Hypothetical protein D9617_3g018300 [Elsinoe fawcettii]|nr:Hypothetical protein D9617_3g018300 [Elsinoe fawcettii]